MDGVGGTIKHRVFRDVKSGKVVIKDAKHFSIYAGSILKGITSLHMPIEVLEESENIISSPQIPGTLEVHKIARSFTNDGVCKLEFFRTAADSSPFHEQWYKKEGDADVCGHDELPLAFNPDQNMRSLSQDLRSRSRVDGVQSMRPVVRRRVFLYLVLWRHLFINLRSKECRY